ncbi:SHQ1-like, partial [Sigmodon hispidus]
MLTPAFELSQDHDFLTITIRVPHARASEFDVYFEEVDFKFYAKPYFLRLTLPGRIVENGSEQGSYDADKGIFTIRLPKETPGQHFKGLNMLTALLAPRKSRSAKPLVEEIGASEASEEGADDEDEEFDWEIEQTPYEEVSESALRSQCHYGFGNLRAGVVQRLQDELSEVIDIKDPDFTPLTERRQKRLAAELAKFDSDHYLIFEYMPNLDLESLCLCDPGTIEGTTLIHVSPDLLNFYCSYLCITFFRTVDAHSLRWYVENGYNLHADNHYLAVFLYNVFSILSPFRIISFHFHKEKKAGGVLIGIAEMNLVMCKWNESAEDKFLSQYENRMSFPRLKFQKLLFSNKNLTTFERKREREMSVRCRSLIPLLVSMEYSFLFLRDGSQWNDVRTEMFYSLRNLARCLLLSSSTVGSKYQTWLMRLLVASTFTYKADTSIHFIDVLSRFQLGFGCPSPDYVMSFCMDFIRSVS